VHKFYKNLAATPKFQASEGQETRSILRNHKYWGAPYKIQPSTTNFTTYMLTYLVKLQAPLRKYTNFAVTIYKRKQLSKLFKILQQFKPHRVAWGIWQW